jgi:hypothetical protein
MEEAAGHVSDPVASHSQIDAFRIGDPREGGVP